MLARSARLPTSGDYPCAVKWDGSRAIASTEGDLRVRSRRVEFPQLSECVLQRRESIPLTFMAFDVLSVGGRASPHAQAACGAECHGQFTALARELDGSTAFPFYGASVGATPNKSVGVIDPLPRSPRGLARRASDSRDRDRVARNSPKWVMTGSDRGRLRDGVVSILN
jgi:hypothetical protein